MRRPRATVMCRNGAARATAWTASSSAGASSKAKVRRTNAPGSSCSRPAARDPADSNSSSWPGQLARVMKDDAERVAMPFGDLADAVAHLDAVVAAGPAHGSAVDGKYDGIALGQRHHGRARLHARSLLRQHELAAAEVRRGLGEKKGKLQRKDVLAVQILVQAVVVAGAVLQEQRRGPCLARGGAARDEFGVR